MSSASLCIVIGLENCGDERKTLVGRKEGVGGREREVERIMIMIWQLRRNKKETLFLILEHININISAGNQNGNIIRQLENAVLCSKSGIKS